MSVTDDLQKDIDEAKVDMALAEALVRLNQNKDFQLVILNGYLVKEAVRLVHEKVKTTEPEVINRGIDSISFLNRYLEVVVSRGESAGVYLFEAQNELDKIYEELGNE